MQELDILEAITPTTFWFYINTVYFSTEFYPEPLPQNLCSFQQEIITAKYNRQAHQKAQQIINKAMTPKIKPQDEFPKKMDKNFLQQLKNDLTKEICLIFQKMTSNEDEIKISQPHRKILNFFKKDDLKQLIYQELETDSENSEDNSNKIYKYMKSQQRKQIEKNRVKKIKKMIGCLEIQHILEILELLKQEAMRSIKIPQLTNNYQTSKCIRKNLANVDLNNPEDGFDLLNMIETYHPNEKQLHTFFQENQCLFREHSSKENQCSQTKRQSNQISIVENYQENDAQCQVCSDGNYTEENLIIFCSGCNISTHQKCIDLEIIPENDWICDLCRYFGRDGAHVPCGLCSQRGGMMLRTKLKANDQLLQNYNCSYMENYSFFQDSIYQEKQYEFKREQPRHFQYYNYFDPLTYPKMKNVQCEYVWIHHSCYRWAYEIKPVFTLQNSGLDRLTKISILIKNKLNFQHTCQVCFLNNSGYCLKCRAENCDRYFHAECARKKKLYMDSGVKQGQYELFCLKHAPILILRTLQKKKQKQREELLAFCSRIQKVCPQFFATYLPSEHIFISSFLREKKRIKGYHEQPQQQKKLFQKAFQSIHKTGQIIININISKKSTKNIRQKKIQKAQIESVVYTRRQQQLQNQLITHKYWKTLFKTLKKQISQKQRQQIVQTFLHNPNFIYLACNNCLMEKINERGECDCLMIPYEMKVYQFKSSVEYCFCRSTVEELEMLECDICSEWYHFGCIGFVGNEKQAQELESFVCHSCMKFISKRTLGKLLRKYEKLFTSDSLLIHSFRDCKDEASFNFDQKFF